MQVNHRAAPSMSTRCMDALSRLLAVCGEGLHLVGGSVPLPFALFMAGLAGSAVHCVGMCGPFVLGQVAGDAQVGRDRRYGEWRRLGGALLVPYHLGRTTTYTALGAMAGGATALFASRADFGRLSSLLLVAAAMMLAAQAVGLIVGRTAPWSGALSRLAAPLSRSQGPAARYGLGLLLGFLPCGLLYGALAAAAGTGSAIEGAAAMSAFSLGTAPSLVAVGWGGLLLRRRLRDGGRWIATPILLANATIMLALASQRV